MSDAACSEFPAGADSGASAGALLRAAREAAGLHVAALAVALKVPVRKLEALEADHLEGLTDAVFVRALASSVCRALKVDPAPILARLPQTVTPRLDRASFAINAPFRAPGDSPGLGLMEQLSRPVVLAVLAFLLGALVLIFLPSVQRSAPTSVASDPGTVPTIATPVTVFTPVVEPQVLGAVSQTPAGDTAPATAALVLSNSLVTESDTPQTPIAGASTEAVAAEGIAIFSVRAESWIEVTDARGVVVMRRLLAAGSSAGVSGALPLQVVVGRADSTEVQVRGKPLDLTRFTRDNVARFEVK
mgnify:FL=1